MRAKYTRAKEASGYHQGLPVGSDRMDETLFVVEQR